MVANLHLAYLIFDRMLSVCAQMHYCGFSSPAVASGAVELICARDGGMRSTELKIQLNLHKMWLFQPDYAPVT